MVLAQIDLWCACCRRASTARTTPNDIDFTRAGIENRWKAGYDHASKVLAAKPWQQQADLLAWIVIHDMND